MLQILFFNPNSIIRYGNFHISFFLCQSDFYFVSAAVRNHILDKIVQYPHIPVRIKTYPKGLFGNINIVRYLFIFKYRYPVNQYIPCQFSSFYGL